MKADLERRVHELLDAGKDPIADPELKARFAEDPEARAEVEELAQVDRWLRDWAVDVPEEDFEAIAQRIEQRLDEPLGSLDATAAPVFDDPDARVRSLGDRSGRSGEYTLEALADHVEAPTPAHMTGPSPGVSLGAPRPEKPVEKPRPLGAMVAAAAAAVLAVVVGMASFRAADQASPEQVSTVAPAEEAEALPPADPWLPPLPGTPSAELAGEAADEGGSVLEAPATAAPAPAPTLGAAEAPEAAEAEESVAEAAPIEALAQMQAVPARRARTASSSSGSSRGDLLVMDEAAAGGASTIEASRGQAAPVQAEAEPAADAEEEQEDAAADEAFRRSRPGVRACLGGAPQAVVMVRFGDGTVRGARVVRPEASAAVDECVTSALRRARLRPEGGQSSRTLFYRWDR